MMSVFPLYVTWTSQSPAFLNSAGEAISAHAVAIVAAIEMILLVIVSSGELVDMELVDIFSRESGG